MTESKKPRFLSQYCQTLSEREHFLFEKARHLLRLAEIEAELEGDINGIGPNEEGVRYSINQVDSHLYGQAEEFSYIN